jgi:hypothetical protein
VGIYVSFQLVVFAFLRQRLRGWTGDGHFRLGRAGLWVAGLAQLYGVLMTINLAWPRPADQAAGWFPIISAVLVVGSGLALLAFRRAQPGGPP